MIYGILPTRRRSTLIIFFCLSYFRVNYHYSFFIFGRPSPVQCTLPLTSRTMMIARADIRPYRCVIRGLHALGWTPASFLHHNPRNSPNSYICRLRIIAFECCETQTSIQLYKYVRMNTAWYSYIFYSCKFVHNLLAARFCPPLYKGCRFRTQYD